MDKDQARTTYRGLRRALSPAERQGQADALVARLVPWLAGRAPGGTVTGVVSYGAELPTAGLLAALHVAGHRVLVPICEPERQLSWADWYPGVPMQRCALAPIDEPAGPRFGVEAMEGTDVVLVPALAVDREGARLGQGGGYYDRFIASLDRLDRRPVLLALVYAHELVPAGTFDYDVLDRKVDGVLTAEGFTWFSQRPGH
jgi:5-formyltetrahydrofolate cyclo-ligase